MEERNFVFYPNWLDCINGLDNDKDRLDLYNIIANYGCYREYHSDNERMVNIFETLIKRFIDSSTSNYKQKVSNGKNFGRKKVVEDNEVKNLANQGFKAKEIAEQLNVSVDAIYHSDGWKNRNL